MSLILPPLEYLDADSRVLSRNWPDWASLGKVTGQARQVGFGTNGDIDTASVPEDIWSGGGLYPALGSAQSLEIVSTDVNDTSAGTGARTVTLTLLDGSYNQVIQTVSLNGTTAVAVPGGTYLRVNGIRVATAGSGAKNAGVVNLQVAGGGTIIGIIEAGRSQMRTSFFTVPTGKTLLLQAVIGSILRSGAAAASASITAFSRLNGVESTTLEVDFTTSSNPSHYPLIPGLAVPATADFCFRCTNVSADNLQVTCGWWGLLLDNTSL